MPIYRLHKRWWLIFLCCLVCVLSACGSTQSLNSTSSQSVSTHTVGPNHTTTPTTKPALQTSCPATGTARAMVTEPLTLGNHPVIVYTANQSASNSDPLMGTLKRYDVTTGSKMVIVDIPGARIDNAQVSNDGQWIFFTSASKSATTDQHGSMWDIKMQVVRIDGQDLQTLYCTTKSVTDFPYIKWSPDKQSIAFLGSTFASGASDPNGNTAVLLLSTSTGQIQSIFVPTSNPLDWSITGFSSWADNTHIYMYGIEGHGQGKKNVYLLDITKGTNQHENNLTTILDGPFNGLASDRSKLYIDYNGCDQYSCSPPSSVVSMPATGGTSQTIWHSTQYNVTEACPINDHQLLVSIMNFQQHPGPSDTSHNGVWIMNSDGTLAQRLTTANQSTAPISNCASGSHGSRDGDMYALATRNQSPSSGQLIFGKTNGGTPTPFATYGDGLFADVVGWTTM